MQHNEPQDAGQVHSSSLQLPSAFDSPAMASPSSIQRSAAPPAFQLRSGGAIQAKLTHSLIRANQSYRTKAYQLSDEFSDYFYEQAAANLPGFKPDFTQFLDILGRILAAYDGTLQEDQKDDPTQAPHKAAIEGRILTCLQGLGQGTSHLPSEMDQADQAVLATLSTHSDEVRTQHDHAQETQSMSLNGTEISAINPNGAPVVKGQASNALTGNKTMESGTSKPKTLGNGLDTQQATQVPVSTRDIPNAHAEIMLLKALIYHIIKVNTLPTDPVYIAGRRVPCKSCQKILNRFELINKGRVKVKYDTAHSAAARGDGNGLKGQNQGNPQDYASSLDTQNLRTDVETAIQTGATDSEVKAWLSDITPLLSYDPKA